MDVFSNVQPRFVLRPFSLMEHRKCTEITDSLLGLIAIDYGETERISHSTRSGYKYIIKYIMAESVQSMASTAGNSDQPPLYNHYETSVKSSPSSMAKSIVTNCR